MIFKSLENHEVITYKEPAEKIHKKAEALVKENFEEEKKLDEEVHLMMDDLERTGGTAFERYKMFPLLKKKLAEKKGFIL